MEFLSSWLPVSCHFTIWRISYRSSRPLPGTRLSMTSYRFSSYQLIFATLGFPHALLRIPFLWFSCNFSDTDGCFSPLQSDDPEAPTPASLVNGDLSAAKSGTSTGRQGDQYGPMMTFSMWCFSCLSFLGSMFESWALKLISILCRFGTPDSLADLSRIATNVDVCFVEGRGFRIPVPNCTICFSQILLYHHLQRLLRGDHFWDYFCKSSQHQGYGGRRQVLNSSSDTTSWLSIAPRCHVLHYIHCSQVSDDKPLACAQNDRSWKFGDNSDYSDSVYWVGVLHFCLVGFASVMVWNCRALSPWSVIIGIASSQSRQSGRNVSRGLLEPSHITKASPTTFSYWHWPYAMRSLRPWY